MRVSTKRKSVLLFLSVHNTVRLPTQVYITVESLYMYLDTLGTTSQPSMHVHVHCIYMYIDGCTRYMYMYSVHVHVYTYTCTCT